MVNNNNNSNVIVEVEQTIARIQSHKGVEGVIILNKDGSIIQSTLDEEQTKSHADVISKLTVKASCLVETLDANDELSFLRIRSHKREIMVSPDKDYLLIVIQNPNPSNDV